MLYINTESLAKALTPALVTLSQVIKKCTEGRVSCHNTSAGHSADKCFLYIKPLMYTLEILGLVILNPVILPYGVLYGSRNRTRYHKRFKKLRNACTGNLNTVGNTLFELLSCTLVHIAHSTADGHTVLIHKHKSLHL